MIIKSIHTSPNNRYLRNAVYGSVNILREYKELKDAPQSNSDLASLLGENAITKQSPYEAIRVAFIHLKYQQTMNLLLAIMNNHDLLEYPPKIEEDEERKNPLLDYFPFIIPSELKHKLLAMAACTPAGVVVDTDKKNIHTCKIYQLCPWCRYRTAYKIQIRLQRLLEPSRKIVVMQFKALSDFAEYEPQHENHHKLIRAYQKKNNFIGGYAITLPEWHALHDVNEKGNTPRYITTINTTLIAITNADQDIIAPYKLTPKTLEDPCFLMPPVWWEWKANKNGLSEALSQTMRHPLQMLTKHHSSDFASQIETILMLRRHFELAPFGKCRWPQDG